jgi:hypothetical protein
MRRDTAARVRLIGSNGRAHQNWGRFGAGSVAQLRAVSVTAGTQFPGLAVPTPRQAGSDSWSQPSQPRSRRCPRVYAYRRRLGVRETADGGGDPVEGQRCEGAVMPSLTPSARSKNSRDTPAHDAHRRQAHSARSWDSQPGVAALTSDLRVASIYSFFCRRFAIRQCAAGR